MPPGTPQIVAGEPTGESRGSVPSDGQAGSNAGRFVKLGRELLKRRDLTAADKLVFAMLAERIGMNGEAWPGNRRLGKDCGLPKSTVADSIQRLERLRMIEVDHVPGNPSKQTNRYRIVATSASRTPASRTPDKRPRTSGWRTELDQGSKTHVQKGAPDPWELVLQAMRGDTLRTDRFRAAWTEWTNYRRQAGKQLTPATIARQIRILEGFGHGGAIQSIEQSIGNGWQGLFDPRNCRGNGGGTSGRTARVPTQPGKYANIGYHPGGPEGAPLVASPCPKADPA